MSQQIRVNLMFDANTSAARSNIQQLATLLHEIATPKTVVVNGGAIQQAAQAAQSLQVHLQNAMNVNTGKLDLTKLNLSLKQAGLNLHELSAKITAIGPQGQMAFMKLANAVAQAGVPAATLNATVSQFLKTMGSAIMWSAAYGALNKVTETIGDAVNYAKDLNKALTDIAIVSDLSADQLDNFADKAAKAAKALNSTTTEYAKAALIFYQQGLNGKAVEERANVVTKMAQVTRESTQDVSDQLTAIWNNFDDGTKSLEYYADAITALGAATASSSKEITQGLEKFAAIADTVGLSYEYATAALATVVANTRQSADVVGTAFKTLFARIQDLELGETLDDGVTLGKYSQAIQAVGVDIMTQNGQLKDMDTILDELGAKWDNLSKAQQTSLAQTVAGMRQYTQFIAIMDNYDEFKRNVGIASDAEGTLTEQWETWANSYEGAAKRVEQRSNELYDALLNDETVIGVTNAFADVISIVGKTVDAIGGLGPVITVILALFSKKLIPLISQASAHFVHNFKVMTGAAQRESAEMQATTQAMVQDMLQISQQGGATSSTLTKQYDLIIDLFEAKKKLNTATKLLSKSEMEEYQIRAQSYELANQELQASLKREAQLKKESASAMTRTIGKHRESIKGAAVAYATQNTSPPEARDHTVKVNSIKEQLAKTEARLAELSEKNANLDKKEQTEKARLTKQVETYKASLEKLNEEHERYLANRANQVNATATANQVVGQVSFTSYDAIQGGDNQYSDAMVAAAMGRQSAMVGGYLPEQNYDVSLNSITQTAEALGRVSAQGEIASSALTEFNAAMSKSSGGVAGESATNFNKLGGALEQLKAEAKITSPALDNLINKLKGVKTDTPESELKELEIEMKKFGSGALSAQANLVNLSGSMIKEFCSKTNVTEAELEQLSAVFEKFGFTVVNNNGQIQILKANLDGLNMAMSRGQGFATLGGQIATTMGQLYMLTAAIEMLKNAWSEEATFGEKFTASLMALSMIMPALTSLFNKDAAARVMAATAAIFQKKAQDAKSKSDIVEAGTQGVNSGAQDINTGSRGANTAATWAQKAAGDAANLTMLQTIGIMLSVVAVGAVLLIAIIAIVEAIQNIETAEEAAIRQTQAAEESLESLGETVKETTTAVEELKTAFDEYDEIQKTLDGLVKGSSDWNEALQKNNEQVREILKLWPELQAMQGAVINNGGMLQLADWAEAYVIANAKMAENAAVYAEGLGQLNVATEKYKYESMAVDKEQSRIDALYNQTDSENPAGIYKQSWDQIYGKGANLKGTITGGEARADIKEIQQLISESGAKTLEEARQYVYDNWNETMHGSIAEVDAGYRRATEIEGLNFIDTTIDAVFSAEQQYQNDKKELEQRELDLKEDYVNQVEQINKNLASSMLSSITGFNQASQVVQKAATDQVARIYQQQNQWVTDAILDPENITEDNANAFIKRFIDPYAEEKSGGIEETAFGSSATGKYIMDYYLEHVKGYSKNEYGEAKVVDGKLTYQDYSGEGSEEKTVSWDEIISSIVAKSQTDPELLANEFTRINNMSAEMQAGLAQDYLYLATEQMANIGVGAEGDIENANAFQTHVNEVIANAYGVEGAMVKWDEASKSFVANSEQATNDMLEHANNLAQSAQQYSTEAAIARQQAEDKARGESVLTQAAADYGLEAKALQVLSQELAETSDLSYEAAAKQTVANAKYAKGVKALGEAIEDNIDELEDWAKTGELTYDTAESVAEVISSLKDMFGVEVSTNFVQTYLKDIKKLIAGGKEAEEAYSKLKDLAVQDYILHLAVDKDAKDALTAAMNELRTLEEQGVTEIDLNTSPAMQALNLLVQSGKLSVEQIQAAFEGMEWSPTFTETFSNTTAKQWIKTVDNVDGIGSTTGGKESWQYIETTTQVPALGLGANSKATFTPKTGKTITSPNTKPSGKGSKSKKKKNEDEIERYHVIDRTLDSLSKKYDRLSNAKDRAFGKQHLDYLDEELALLEEEGKAIQQKIEENRKYYEEDRALMAGYGATFDENGNITNYEELVAEQVAKYNKNPDKYGDDYEAFKKALENYESTLDTMSDLTDKEIENINKKFDTELAKITYQVELEVRLSDDAMALIEFQLENLTDNVGDLAKKLGLLGSSLDTTVRKLTSTETALKGLLEKGGINWDDLTKAIENGTVKELLESGTMTEEQIQSMESELSNMYSYVNELREGMDQVSEFIIAAFEDSHKEFDKSIEQMEYFVSLADSYLNIIELAGRQSLGISNDILVAIRKSSMEITRTNISMRKAQLDADEAALANAKAKLLTTTDEGERQEIQESIDEIESKVRESQQALLEETSNGLQAAVDLFGAEMDGIQEKFENSMTGAYGTFAAMKASYDQMQERDDWYLDDYEKIYELSKLNRDIINSIDETDNIRAKETLRDLQAEINKLQESGAEITQHEVDYLRAKYELRLAEIALEDAQNAKTQVRMRRDSEGNWGYVYTADEAAVGSAQQNYEDKLYAMQKKLNETVDAMEERLIAIPEEYANAVREIYEDQTLTDEERRLRIQETQNHYQEMYARAADLLEATTGRSAELYEVDWTKYSEMTGSKISKNQDWVDSFSKTYIATLTGFTSSDGALAQFKKASDTMLEESGKAYGSYRDTIKQMLGEAGIDIANFVGGEDSGVAKMFKQAGDDADAAATRVKQLASDFGSVFSTALDIASKTYSGYSDAIDQWVSKTEGLGKAIQKVLEEYAKLDKKKEEQDKLPEPKPTDPPKSSGGGKGDGDDKDKDPPKTTTYKKLPGDIQLYLISSLQGGFESTKLKKGTQFESASIKNSDGAHYFSGVIKGASNPVGGYIDPDVAQILKDAGWSKFDTGGYTGSWDSSGRLAMLHQKELVLNAHDTANFLSAIDILRDITSIIDLQALSQSNMLSALSSATAGIANQVIEQEVTIHAEFPNATNHSEIEEAFNSLLNRASQFANRKNK